MSRIREKFGELKRSGRGGFIPFITAGDPDLATTERLLVELANAGADIIELGVPFSDPVADGEVIQRASERGAAKRRDRARRAHLREEREAAHRYAHRPLQLFQSAAAIRPGTIRPAQRDEAGIDAVLVTDLIPEEAESWTADAASTPTRSNLSGRANHLGQTARANRAASARIYLRSFARWRDGRARSNDARC